MSTIGTDSERGFTVSELMIVVVLVTMVCGVTISAYGKRKERAHQAVARANIEQVAAAIEAYRFDFASGSGYVGMTIGGAEGLRAVYDPALAGWDEGAGTGVTILSTARTTFCIKSVARGVTYYKNGPLGEIARAPVCS
jgi:type II secretory pathway pseudopilin PulG